MRLSEQAHALTSTKSRGVAETCWLFAITVGTALSTTYAGFGTKNGLSGKRYDCASKADERPIALASLGPSVY